MITNVLPRFLWTTV